LKLGISDEGGKLTVELSRAPGAGEGDGGERSMAKALRDDPDRVKRSEDAEHVDMRVQLDEDAEIGEVAAIIDAQGATAPRTLLVHFRDALTTEGTCVNALDRKYEALRYPLINQRGKLGWGPTAAAEDKLWRNTANAMQGSMARSPKVTLLQYLQQTALREPRIRQLHAVGQAWLVDQMSRLEDMRLFFYADQRLASDHAWEAPKAGRDDADLESRLQGIAPPVTFVKSDAWFKEKLSDAMCILARFGRPDFFVTVTTNPNWPELKKHSTCAAEDPILTTQVFNAKLKKLLDVMKTNRSPLGKLAYRIGVIEFQKRGLPHAHLLIYAEDRSDKGFDKDPSLADKYVCTEVGAAKTERGRALVREAA
jgi:hypothetical protein